MKKPPHDHPSPGRQLALAALVSIPILMVNHAGAATPILEDLVVTANALQEESPTGTYSQPEWTGHRRFSSTRVYIQKDPGEMGIEEWYRVRTYDGGRVTQRFQQEFEIGLPYRMQLDIYEKLIHDNEVSGWKQDEVAVELRYAFADWGVNFINAHELWDQETTTWSIAAGLSRTIIDSKLSIGIEGQWSHSDHRGWPLMLETYIRLPPPDAPESGISGGSSPPHAARHPQSAALRRDKSRRKIPQIRT